MRHINNFDRKLDRRTKMGNIVIVQVQLNFPNIFGYQKVHFMIIQAPFEDFTLNHTRIVSWLDQKNKKTLVGQW